MATWGRLRALAGTLCALAACIPMGCGGVDTQAATAAAATAYNYAEAIDLRALRDGRVHVVLNLTVTAADDGTAVYNGFPKVFGEVARYTKLTAMQLSLVRGVWTGDVWGGMAVPAPSATTLMASFGTTSRAGARRAWGTLADSLSGLSCASLQFFALGNPSHPVYARADVVPHHRDGWDFWGALPAEESVCTENLAPLLSLFPHRGKAGVSKALTPQQFFGTPFHGITLQYARGGEGDGAWTHTLSLIAEAVFEPGSAAFEVTLPDAGACPLCTGGRGVDVRLHIDDPGLAAAVAEEPGLVTVATAGAAAATAPQPRLAKVEGPTAGTGVSMKLVSERAPAAPARASPQPGVAVGFASALLAKGGVAAGASPAAWKWTTLEYFSLDGADDVGVLAVEVRPAIGVEGIEVEWMLPLLLIQPYVSTLKVRVDVHEADAPAAAWKAVPNYTTTLYHDENLLLLKAKLPVAGAPRMVLKLNYDKKILPLDAYPPDANRLYLLPPVALWAVDAAGVPAGPFYSPVPAAFTLGTPDFSMPFNAITLTCTAISMLLGTIFRQTTGDYPAPKEDKA